jgi:hypothetical protein
VNRDGYRAVDAAGHEAAHAVVAVLSGVVVRRISIAPSRKTRKVFDGFCVTYLPQVPWAIPLSSTAGDDVAAAGFAWDLHALRAGCCAAGSRWTRWRHAVPHWWRAWSLAAGDWVWMESQVTLVQSVRRVRALLAEPAVRAAVEDVAAAVVAQPSGEILGTTVQQIMHRHGLIPAVELQVGAA